MSRPSLLNEELIKKFEEELSQGLPVRYTCDLLGITQPSFSNWMSKGEDNINEGNEETLYAQFFIAIKKAQALYVKNSLTLINSGVKNWQSIAWALERTRQDFMPKQAIQANTDDGKVTVILGGKVKDFKKDDNSK